MLTLTNVPSYASPEIAGAVAEEDATPEFAELVRVHGARVWRSLRYLGVPDADVADASQEVFLVVHRRLAEFRNESKLETWLYGICLGVARNARRRRLRDPATTEPGDDVCEATQESDLDVVRMRAALRWALDRIPPEQREVFVLYEIEELGMRAIARTVSCPLFTAYSRLRLARRNLARLLESKRRDLI